MGEKCFQKSTFGSLKMSDSNENTQNNGVYLNLQKVFFERAERK